MLLLQAPKLRAKLAFFLWCHRRLGRAVDRPACTPSCTIWAPPGHGVKAGKFLWIIAFWLTADKPEAKRCTAGIFAGRQREYLYRRSRWCSIML